MTSPINPLRAPSETTTDATVEKTSPGLQKNINQSQSPVDNSSSLSKIGGRYREVYRTFYNDPCITNLTTFLKEAISSKSSQGSTLITIATGLGFLLGKPAGELAFDIEKRVLDTVTKTE